MKFFTGRSFYFLLVSVFFSCFILQSVQAEDKQPRLIPAKQTESSTDAETSHGKESAKLLDVLSKINRQLDEISALENTINSSEGEALNTAIILRRDKSNELLTGLKLFAKLARSLSKEDADIGEVIKEGQQQLRKTGKLMRNEIDRYNARIEKHSKGRNTLESAGLKSYINDSNLIDVSLAMLVEYIDIINSINQEAALSIQYLEKELPKRADFLAGQIALSKDRQKDFLKILDGEKDNSEARNQLALTQEKLDADIASLKKVILFGSKLELEMQQYQALLVKATGEISAQTLDAEVLGVLFEEWWLKSKIALQENTVSFLIKAIVFVLIIMAFKFLASVVRRLIERSLNSRRVKATVLLKNMLASIAANFVLLMGVLVALAQFGISLAPVLAGLGVVGFIVGFALQDTLGNFAAGIMILFYRPYDVGDSVEVSGVIGKVKNMSIVNTTVLTPDNQTLIIPNSKIWGDVIKNITAQKVRRIDMTFGIGYDDDIKKTETVLIDIVTNHDKVLASPEPIVKLHNLGESSVDFVVRPWVKTEHYWEVYWDITREVKTRFDDEGISIPFPQRDVHLYQASS